MSTKKQFSFSRLTMVALGLGLLFLALNITQTSCGGNAVLPQLVALTIDTTQGTGKFIKPVLSGVVPTEVAAPPNDTVTAPEPNRPLFDHFSWQMFIALCWPVDPNQRGVPLSPNDPNTFLNMTNTTPVVWTSYKNQWDLFGQGTNTPSPWSSWTDPVGLCQQGQNVKHVFGTAKSGMLPGDGDESFSVPLVDQNKNYALFEIKYNEAQYNFIVNNGLYLKSNLVKYQIAHGDTIAMPSSTTSVQGAILVKAAWKYLNPQKDDLSRYYVIDEIVYDPVIGQCSKQLMGLVGLHIAQKVDGFPQWIWSSFEQVDNVPGAPNSKAPYSFNNGTTNPATKNGYANKPSGSGLIADSADRVPVQVTRLNPIPTTPAGFSTVDINQMYQAAVGKTWMRNYQLVITQWPSNPGVFASVAQGGVYPRDCGQAFPATSCVNTTMETYFQSQNDAVGAGGNSCMSCHYTATTDFSWSLQLRAH